MLEQALQYAARGWPIFPLTGYKTPFKGSHGHLDATCHPDSIHAWWGKRPKANIGLATGDIVVLDADGPGGLVLLQQLAQSLGGLPRTLTAQTARGLHLYFKAPAGAHIRTRNGPRSKAGDDGLDIKAHGGFVVVPPSINAKNGFQYKWLLELPIAELPFTLTDYLQGVDNKGKRNDALPQQLGERPAFLQDKQRANGKVSSDLQAARRTPWTEYEEQRIRSALLAISADCERDTWLHLGMALHTLGWERPDGTDGGYEIWGDWSATGKTKYQGEHDLATRWRSFGKAGREQVTLGTLYHIAQQHGWQGFAPRAVEPHPLFTPAGGAATSDINGYTLPAALTAPTAADSPLIDLNRKYAVIGDVGGKCLVLGWIRSKIDDKIEVPSFQTFKSFAERFSHKYVQSRTLKDTEWEEKTVQLGGHWLKWGHRTSYEAIDMVPNAPQILPNNTLNLWRGFAIEPKQGSWDLMKQHIARVLAGNNVEALTYILRWAAWKIQNPGERAEAALVFKGDKGSGKGTFANAIKRIFGPHGLQIFNSKHMTGQFNAHLRTCLLLYADEAFWAGDKQGESVLKGMLTEPTLLIEQKGVDATAWTNRLGIIMSTNAEWVVPASEKERRYAVFQVNGEHAGDLDYFEALYHEMNNSGLAAMLYDLQKMPLGNWHPRIIPQTQALQEQKRRSFDPRFEWFETLLSEGDLPGSKKGDTTVSATILYEHFKAQSPDIRHCSRTAFGTFLRSFGCIKLHTAHGNVWQFKSLPEHRTAWEKRFGLWEWSYRGAQWLTK